MKKNVYGKPLVWMLIACMLVTLFPSTSSAGSLPQPTGLKLGIGEIEKPDGNGGTMLTHYASCATMLGLHFNEAQEIEDNGGYYRWNIEEVGTLSDGSEQRERTGGGAVYPFAHLFVWLNDFNTGHSIGTRHFSSIEMAFRDENDNKGPTATLNTDITVNQVESSDIVTVNYIGTEHPSWSTDPTDQEARFKISGLPANHSLYFGNPNKSGSFSESGNGGIVEIKDSYHNGKWYLGLGDMEVGANETYCLDVYDTAVTNDTTATLTITRHPVNIVFNSFDVTVGGALTYTGNTITPTITVNTTGDIPILLTKDTDYTVSFEKNGSSVAASEVKNAGEYTAIITGKADTDYAGKVATKSFTITKATLASDSYTAPTNLAAVYGQTLEDISLPTGFRWQDASATSVGNVGTNTFKAQYNPDSENYNSITGIDLPILVSKANQTQPVLTLSTSTGMIGLTPPALTVTGGGGTGALHFVSSNPSVATVDSATGAIAIVAAGTTMFTATKDGDSNHNASIESAGITLTVKDKVSLSVKDTAATEAAIVAHLKNQGQIYVTTPIRAGLSNHFTVSVNGKNPLTTYASSNAQQGEAKWIGLLIGNLQVNDATAYSMTDLYYKTSESGSYTKLTEIDQKEAQQVGGTDKELVLWIKSDVDATKNIWLATSSGGDNETKLTVNFTAYSAPSTPSTPSTPSNGGGHSGGGGGGGGSSITPTPTSSTSSTETITSNGTTAVSATVTATTDTKGTASITVPSKTVTGLIEKAKIEEAKNKKAIIAFQVKTDSTAKAAEVKIEKVAFNTITKETKAEMAIETALGSITFDKKALDEIGNKASEDISIRMETMDGATLSDAVKAVVGDRPVYDMTVLSGENKISSFEGGSASICIPYTLKSGEDENAVVVYYVGDSGALQTVRGAYNTRTKTVDFIVSHFSKYAVGYHMVSYSDVSNNAWYGDAVKFISARGIAKGTTETTFSPNKAITRGEFIVMLMRAYGIAPKENSVNNFIDAGNTYYTSYLAAAKDRNITQGVGDNLYRPDDQISRQDMITMLYRTLKAIGEVPESSKGAAQFNDSNTIASYAKSSVEALVAAGIISGNNGKLEPIEKTTRAEMAQTLFNLLSK